MQTEADEFVISGGTIIDGTGAPRDRIDLLISHGIITDLLHPGIPTSDRPRIDVTGLVVCPGFIDVHSHADNAPFLSEPDLTKARQGVTTQITGNCGKSLAPEPSVPNAEFDDHQWRFFALREHRGPTVGQWFQALDDVGSIVNSAPLIGQGTLRSTVMGFADRPATGGERLAMADLLRDAMDRGAFGLSSGLIYPPGVYTSTDELSYLAAALPKGAIYTTHMRNESGALRQSVAEAISVGRAARVRVEVSHLKATGRANWGGVERALEDIDAARDSGVAIAQDVYPYSAASTTLTACLPPWANAGGSAAVLKRLGDPAECDRMRRDISGHATIVWDNLLEGAGFDGILVVTTKSGQYEGLTLAKIAEKLDVDPLDALFTVLIEEQLDASMVEFSISDADVCTVLSHPHTVIGSDGLAPGRGGRPHPRLFGTFPRVLGEFVARQGLLSLESAVARMTGTAARRFRIPQRGIIAPGMVADLVAFEPTTVGHPTDYLNPDQPPTGIAWVMIGGRTVVKDSNWTGARVGRRLVPAT